MIDHQCALLARQIPDQPCNCFRVPHAFYCVTVSPPLVPGYWETADGKADVAEQRKQDQR
jgi:hypothetical protein